MSPCCLPAGVWMVTMVTRSWVRGATVAPACALMGRAVDGSFPTAATFWLTSWCVCAAPATKVRTHTHTPKTHTVHRFVSCRCDTPHLRSSRLHKQIIPLSLKTSACFLFPVPCRCQVRPVCSRLLRQPAGARRPLHALPVQQQHRHARPGLV